MPLLTLCADDFGLNSAVNEGIIRLVKAGRLNAVSCMVGGAEFSKGLPMLMKACEAAPIKVEIGLHLTFTEYQPLGSMKKLAPKGELPSVGMLLLKSHLRLLDVRELHDEMARQWQCFVETVGKAPDFMDGHQHVHLFPQLREAVVELAKTKFQDKGWVRSCHADSARLRACGLPSTRASARVLIISYLAKHMAQKLQQEGVKTNPVFYGINDFNKNENFADLMQVWVSLAAAQKEWAVIMCHPGLKSDNDSIWDPIAARRIDEFEVLSRSDSIYNLK
ncbi:MAG: ChbG/HpnK family deacetylase [Hyphomicrobiales bacterium]